MDFELELHPSSPFMSLCEEEVFDCSNRRVMLGRFIGGLALA